jgi:hypothetical protein
LAAGLNFTDNGNGTATISGTPLTGAGGAYAVSVTASSTSGAVTQSFALTVNEAPVIGSASQANGQTGTPFSFLVSASGYPPPTISVSGLPSPLTLTKNGDGTATISGTPTKGGQYSLAVTATNAAGKATQTLVLVISQPPAITSATHATATVGTAFSFTVKTTGYPVAAVSASGVPAGLNFTDNGNGTATMAGTPLTGTGGVYSVVINASSTAGVVSQNFALTVNEAPTITSANQSTAHAGAAFSFLVTTTGYPLPTIAVSGLPTGLTLTRNGDGTATISGTPKKSGIYTVTITATNPLGKATQTFTLTVS